MVRFRAPSTAPSSEAIAWLLGSVVPLRTDLAGRVTGWYRLAADGRRLTGECLMGSVDPGTVLDLVFVENRTILLDLEIRTGVGTTRLRAPVGTAVPVVALVDHLASMFDLPEGEWRVLLKNRLLHPHEILADHDLRDGERLVVMRA